MKLQQISLENYFKLLLATAETLKKLFRESTSDGNLTSQMLV